MNIRKIIQEEIQKVFEADYYDSYPDFLDPQFNPQMGAYPVTVIPNYGTVMKEELALDRAYEEQKPYKFYLLCDKLCDLEGVEVKNQMIADATPVSKEEFINSCAYSESLLVYENISEKSDPSTGFYKSNVKGVPCYYVQYAGFEFIFTEHGESGREYWLEEMFDEEGSFIYETIQEDYPEMFKMEEFKALATFDERIRYCEAFLQRISSGSGRIAYKIDDEKVLKLAKNKKGIAQNEVEHVAGQQPDIKGITARVFDADENYLWIEMELARKMKMSDFKRITGFDFQDFAKVVQNYGVDSGVDSGRNTFKREIPKELEEAMWDDEFVREILQYMPNYDVPSGDLTVPSSYGIVQREWGEDIVMIDYGFNKSIQADYYS